MDEGAEVAALSVWDAAFWLLAIILVIKVVRSLFFKHNTSHQRQQDKNELKTFSYSEIEKHNNGEDCWLIVDGKVYDVTPYVENHPGGDAIFKRAGKDNTQGFHGPQHPDHAKDRIQEFLIGYVKEEKKNA